MVTKVLHITSSLDGGGIASLLYQYCSRMIKDGYLFDFVVTEEKEGFIEKKLKDIGCNVFHVSKMRESPFRYFKQIKKIIKSGNYNIVHNHSSYKSYFTLRIAKKNGVKIRIAHAHSAIINESFFSKLIRKIFTPLTISKATKLFACGEYAGKWAWKDNNFIIMPNAINIDDFSFSNFKRNELRKELNIEKNVVIGTVSRISEEKNHLFLLDIFKEYLMIDNSAILVIVGDGPLFDIVKGKVSNMNLDDKVKFLGVRKDVHDLLNCFDCFILPSKYEGLPVTIVEAEANGLPCLISESVTKEVKINSNVEYMSLDKNCANWAKKIEFLINQGRVLSDLSNSCFNIEKAILFLEGEYNG